jgi:hypothetical protein
MSQRLAATTRRASAAAFRRLDYQALASVYCDEGGAAFWDAMRKPCLELGLDIALALRGHLRSQGRSLYVGAGVAEIPALIMETLELGRVALAYNLRRREVLLLRAACQAPPLDFRAEDASRASGSFDHMWMVSVLNDPEEFPELSRLSYGRADPARFRPSRFAAQRRVVRRLADRCLRRLTLPGLVTTSVEETVWIEEWCQRRGVACRIEDDTYPTAIVGDPVCFMRLG